MLEKCIKRRKNIEQNVPNPLSDEAIASLIDDIANERLEAVQIQSDGFMNILDDTLPFQ